MSEQPPGWTGLDRAAGWKVTPARPTAAEVLREVAYAQIADERGLTVLPTGPGRAQVPRHWWADADLRARPYIDALAAAGLLATSEAETAARAWDEGFYAATGGAPGDVWLDAWDDLPNPYRAAALRAGETGEA